MTQEDKELLLADLCARLSYGVIGLYTWKCRNSHNRELTGNLYDELELSWLDSPRNSQFLPYLRPISSMTEEEKKELQKVTDDTFYTRSYYIGNSKPYTDGEWHTSHNNFVTNIVCNKLISWLDKNHFDHRTDDEDKTLIEKGLALEAPEGMYNLNK